MNECTTQPSDNVFPTNGCVLFARSVTRTLSMLRLCICSTQAMAPSMLFVGAVFVQTSFLCIPLFVATQPFSLTPRYLQPNLTKSESMQ